MSKDQILELLEFVDGYTDHLINGRLKDNRFSNHVVSQLFEIMAFASFKSLFKEVLMQKGDKFFATLNYLILCAV